MSDRSSLKSAAQEVRLGPLEDSLGFLLRLAQLTAFEDYYTHMGETDVRPGEMSALVVIGENPGIRQGLVAWCLKIKRSHMTKMVRAMETEGLVIREVPDSDRRSVNLSLTEAGYARLEQLRAPMLTHEVQSDRRLTARQTDQLKRLLRKYIDLPLADFDPPN